MTYTKLSSLCQYLTSKPIPESILFPIPVKYLSAQMCLSIHVQEMINAVFRRRDIEGPVLLACRMAVGHVMSNETK